MTIEEIRKNAPSVANFYIKKPFQKIKYLHGDSGIYWYLNKSGVPFEMCRDWIFWIKPL